MKKIVSNLSVMIFVIGCAIMEITTWFIDSYVMFYIGIIIVIVGIIGMIIQGKFKKVIILLIFNWVVVAIQAFTIFLYGNSIGLFIIMLLALIVQVLGVYDNRKK